MSKLKEHKLSLILALTAVIVIAGIILYALLGFNTMPDRDKHFTFEVEYDVVVEVSNQEEALQKLCEDTFANNGLHYVEKEVLTQVDSSSLSESTDTTLVYTFSAGVSTESLQKAADAVNSAAQGEGYADAVIFASWHKFEGNRFYDYAWRGAIALAVAAIVALAYVAVRYGVSCGVAGLAVCAQSTLFTVALFAVTRFPVYAFAPALYAGITAFMSVLLWVFLCGKFREGFKAAGTLSGEEVIRNTVKASTKLILLTAGVFGLAIFLLGVIGTPATMLAVLPALVGVAVATCSVLFFGEEVCIPIRRAFDKRRASKKRGYVGKKKAETEAE